MTLISDSALASLQKVMNSSLPDRVTIARTDISTDCRVKAETTELRLGHMPSTVRFRRWLLIMPALVSGDALDVRLGDTLTVTRKDMLEGTYVVVDVDQPRSYQTSTRVYCLQSSLADGSLPMMTNATVVFSRLQQDGSYATSDPTPVYIEPVRPDEMQDPYATRVLREVWFPSSTQIAGIAIQPDDKIVWTGLISPDGMATLHRPMVHPGPLPYSSALFAEPS